MFCVNSVSGYTDGAAANCSLIQASTPIAFSRSKSACVGPHVACRSNRQSARSLAEVTSGGVTGAYGRAETSADRVPIPPVFTPATL